MVGLSVRVGWREGSTAEAGVVGWGAGLVSIVGCLGERSIVGARFPRPDFLGIPNYPECDDVGRSRTSRAWNTGPYNPTSILPSRNGWVGLPEVQLLREVELLSPCALGRNPLAFWRGFQTPGVLKTPGVWLWRSAFLPFLLDLFEVFGGSELAVELVGGLVVLLGEVGVVFGAVELGKVPVGLGNMPSHSELMHLDECIL